MCELRQRQLLQLGTHDFKADLWSLGILLFVLLGNRFPFDGNIQAARQTQDGVNAEIEKLPVSATAHALLLGLLRLQAGERLPLEKLATHEWLDIVGSGVATPKMKRRKLAAKPSNVDTMQTPDGSTQTAEPEGSTQTPDGSGAAAAASSEPKKFDPCHGLAEPCEKPQTQDKEEDLSQLSVGELKKRLFWARAADPGAGIEKAELIAAVKQAEAAKKDRPQANLPKGPSEVAPKARPEPDLPKAQPAAPPTTPAPAAVEIAPELSPQTRRRSWVDCSPEEAEATFLEKQEKLGRLTARGFDSTMAEIALQSADWNVDTAILMLQLEG